MVIEYNPKVTILWNGRHNIRLCSETFMCELVKGTGVRKIPLQQTFFQGALAYESWHLKKKICTGGRVYKYKDFYG